MKPELRVLIIDDEAMACDMLEFMILRNVPPVTTVKKATSVSLALELIDSYRPDLLFLDIQMPFMSGFEFLASLPADHAPVIFTTAFNKYAITAIRFSALDYLLKPVDPDELRAAVDRFVMLRDQDLKLRERYEGLKELLQSSSWNDYKLSLVVNGAVKMVKLPEILYCTGINNYTKFHFIDGQSVLVSRTIKDYEDMLYEFSFKRIHKSHLVNISHVKEVNSNRLILTDGTALEISRRRLHEVLEEVKKFKGLRFKV